MKRREAWSAQRQAEREDKTRLNICDAGGPNSWHRAAPRHPGASLLLWRATDPPTAVCLCGSSSSYVRVRSLLLGHTRPIVAMKDCEKESSANRTRIELFPTPAQAADGTGGLSGMQQRSSSRVSSAQPPGADSGRPQTRVERTEVVMERLRRDAVAAPVRRGLLAAGGHGCGSMRTGIPNQKEFDEHVVLFICWSRHAEGSALCPDTALPDRASRSRRR